MKFIISTLLGLSALSANARELRTCEMRIYPAWTIADITATVDRVAATGMNGIRVETFYHGGTIYKSAVMKKWGFPEIRPDFAKRSDALKALIRAAHARNISVYAWVETFYVWNTSLGEGNPILTRYPGWSVRNADGTVLPKHGEREYCFISPANLQARRFIRELYAEIAQTGVDGLLVDYLRYPVRSLGPKDPLSFDAASVRRAKEELGIDIAKVKWNLDDPVFQRWTRWRVKQTSDFARELALAVRKANPKVLFAASVHPYPGPDWRRHDTLRDWPKWYPEVTVFSPQYYTDAETARNWAAVDLKSMPAKCLLWPNILASDIADGSPIIEALRGPRVIGFSHWQYSAITDEDAVALKAGPYKK